MAKDTIVGLKELRLNIEKYAKEVGRGASFTVVRRSKPLFRIAPVEEDGAGWEVLFDADRDNKGKGIRADQLFKALKRMRKNG